MASRHSAENVEMRIRELCCLGTGGKIAVPMIYRELHKIVPHQHCLVMWMGEKGVEDAYTYDRQFLNHMSLYMDRYFSVRESDIWPTIHEGLTHEYGIHHINQVLRVSRCAYEKHPLYNEIGRPADLENVVRYLVHDTRRPLATFMAGRGKRDKDFDEGHLRTLKRLRPFIDYALTTRDAIPDIDRCDDDNALIVTDRNGNVALLSDAAQQLLSLANGSNMAPPVLSAALLRIVRMLGSIAKGEHDTHPPVWRTVNSWGEFEARAYWLQPNEPGESKVGIYLQRRIPRALRMFDNISRLNLPPKQEEVCRLLVLDLPEERIASQLGVSTHTIVYHRRQIYARLEVNSRAELIARLSRPVG